MGTEDKRGPSAPHKAAKQKVGARGEKSKKHFKGHLISQRMREKKCENAIAGELIGKKKNGIPPKKNGAGRTTAEKSRNQGETSGLSQGDVGKRGLHDSGGRGNRKGKEKR